MEKDYVYIFYLKITVPIFTCTYNKIQNITIIIIIIPMYYKYNK
jgi:hypothetical protein